MEPQEDPFLLHYYLCNHSTSDIVILI